MNAELVKKARGKGNSFLSQEKGDQNPISDYVRKGEDGCRHG